MLGKCRDVEKKGTFRRGISHSNHKVGSSCHEKRNVRLLRFSNITQEWGSVSIYQYLSRQHPQTTALWLARVLEGVVKIAGQNVVSAKTHPPTSGPMRLGPTHSSSPDTATENLEPLVPQRYPNEACPLQDLRGTGFPTGPSRLKLRDEALRKAALLLVSSILVLHSD